MNFRKVVAGAVMVQGLALLGLSAANANVILTYTGNDFTSVAAPYTTSDKVTASITLANPLGDNLSLAGVTPLAFTLSDGVDTLSSADTSIAGTFVFSTNANGVITAWLIGALNNVAGVPSILSRSFPTTDVIDSGLTAAGADGHVLNDPGTWTVSSVTVPEPPTASVLGVGLLGLSLLFWRRRRKLDLAQ